MRQGQNSNAQVDLVASINAAEHERDEAAEHERDEAAIEVENDFE